MKLTVVDGGGTSDGGDDGGDGRTERSALGPCRVTVTKSVAPYSLGTPGVLHIMTTLSKAVSDLLVEGFHLEIKVETDGAVIRYETVDAFIAGRHVGACDGIGFDAWGDLRLDGSGSGITAVEVARLKWHSDNARVHLHMDIPSGRKAPYIHCEAPTRSICDLLLDPVLGVLNRHAIGVSAGNMASDDHEMQQEITRIRSLWPDQMPEGRHDASGLRVYAWSITGTSATAGAAVIIGTAGGVTGTTLPFVVSLIVLTVVSIVFRKVAVNENQEMPHDGFAERLDGIIAKVRIDHEVRRDIAALRRQRGLESEYLRAESVIVLRDRIHE